MPGLLGTAPTPDLPPGRRLALVIATATYADAGLRQLRAPARDASDLARVLADPRIGGFAVTSVIDQSAQAIRLAVEDLVADRRPQDELLVYLSCHGLLDPYRRLYFAATDTRKNRLGATGVESAWIKDQLEHCRARIQILILDSCFSGAFAHGAKGNADLDLEDRFAPKGHGRVVLTSSNAMEYSFEGDPADPADTPGSVFTTILVAGLQSGAADIDHDGLISVEDAYAYTCEQIKTSGYPQTPLRWLYGAEGKIVLARSRIEPEAAFLVLVDALRAGLSNPHPQIRAGAVQALGEWLASDDPHCRQVARYQLRELADRDDDSAVAATARHLLKAHLTTPGWVSGQEPPHPVDYIQALQAPTRCFIHPRLKRAQLTRDSWGLPEPITGVDAVVFHAVIDGDDYALRFYTRRNMSSRERYEAFDSYVTEHQLIEDTASVIWYEDAVLVDGMTWPVQQMDWIEGQLLDAYVGYLTENANTDALGLLAGQWRALIHRLQEAEFAHGDLQHGNVLVDRQGRLRLVDFDGVWIPPLRGQPPLNEMFHINYQHPGRVYGAGWGPCMDTFSALVIYLSIKALAKEPELWLRFYTGENLVFVQRDFQAPFDTAIWQQLVSFGDAEINHLAQTLRQCCAPGWVADSSLRQTIQ